ncbi:ACP S-malonyltransferase [Leucobacter triazinivorans]|uniref:[acyl-carrier-protein] S-malonyltransferase n=1 Tax=Leucobacter triazinivorans TaxID=1784719 RepID=A0A4P6KB18_9MICO|nr:ACP S-malonyltransferase [Leucobacter triazinivorans]QBE47475.1 ACP S-malonyltransferase [Leucobacter triazinivorans]
MIVIACPGQGSQTPGFLNEWLELPGARDFLGEASERAGVDLVQHGTESDADTIRDTAVAQPLIVAASLLAWRELSARTALGDAGVAGHSVGEFAAAAAVGILSESDALRLVGVRGRAMARAAAEADTGMAAVVGGVEADVLDRIAAHGLTPANRNGGGQIVAAGSVEALAALAEDAPRGARVIRLQVAGAFHTEYMAGAISALREAAEGVTPADPKHPLWTNADGSRVTDGARFVELLVSQVANPVRWDACMESFQEAGITGLVELAPGGALTGIAKRALKGVPSVAITSPADLDAAVALVAEAA